MKTPSARPENARLALLKSAAAQFHHHGFQAASLEAILEDAGVTKGALYHHFRNKKELGLAVLDEVYRDAALTMWRDCLATGDRPLEALVELLGRMRSSLCLESVEHGCPLHNLAQEMADEDEGFRRALDALMEERRGLIAAALARGVRAGTVDPGVDGMAQAAFITAVVEGAMGAAKTARDPRMMDMALGVLVTHLESLLPGRAEVAPPPRPGSSIDPQNNQTR